MVYGDSPAILYSDTCCRTWSQTNTRCLQLASSIASLGITRGDVVSVVAPNVPAMVELHFAVPMSGAVLNTVNLRLDATAISNLLRHGESRLVFVNSGSLSVVRDALALFPANFRRPPVVVIDEGDQLNTEKSLKINGDHDQFLNYEALIELGNPNFKWIRPLSEWDPITLNYTSGTTCSSKGVVQSHRGAMLIAVDSLLHWSVPPRPTFLWTLPMFHANGWSFAWGMAAVGAANVCLRSIDAAAIYDAIQRFGVTHMCGAPVVLNMLANHHLRRDSGENRKQLESPVHILTAGAPPPAAVLARVEALGFVVSHGYGLTETGGLVVTCAWKPEWDKLPAPERARHKARQGVRSIMFAEMDVLDPSTGTSVAKDGSTLGEVVLRGGSLMLGYLKDPDETAKCMTKDGWFYTGDVGVVHPDGYLEVKDRSKDIIICGGENVSSVEVEAVLYTHPAVEEAAVVARPSNFWGETPCAFVRLKETTTEAEKPTKKEIREFCKERLPLYMVPRMVVFVEDLPKTSTGKLQKFLLRDMAKYL
ncbi:2-methylpropanoate--CoA ligase CCL4-like [Andrographis paniculata]|uniref:2-methylpropanoate--CoA ligase CCL4-like n=1 Tax=Andrographis paniculata TaxID=175694 RepID=UPI0021E910B8|nr:2-methylpropanoate--CoA ligase CCL4-like [Andrographis paniculata]